MGLTIFNLWDEAMVFGLPSGFRSMMTSVNTAVGTRSFYCRTGRSVPMVVSAPTAVNAKERRAMLAR